MSESFAELLKESPVWGIQPGAIIDAEVVSIGQDAVTISTGLKSESIVPMYQFLDESGDLEVELGDTVSVTLEAVEDGYGETRVSREKAKRLATWDSLEEAFSKDEIVRGKICERIKGGFMVDIKMVRAFLPASLVDPRLSKDMNSGDNRPILDFKIIKIDRQNNNVVVSRRAVAEKESELDIAKLMETLEEGNIVAGRVKNTTSYGAFIDLGGIDGLLHITDMSWKRVKDPADFVNVDEEISLKVLKFDREKNRVSLGLKQMEDDPWTTLLEFFPQGTQLKGKVTNLADYGCFVELRDGIEGLVHVSEMDWTNKNVHPSKLVHSGDEVEVKVLHVDMERRRVSLGMKQCKPNPWVAFAEKYKKGDHITGNIKSITDFGIFLGLEGDIDGLVHLSDISWLENGEKAIRDYSRGQELETKIISVDAERERISLGIKQLSKDPFSAYISEHPKGSIVNGIAKSIESKGFFVELSENVTGYIRASEISSGGQVEDARIEIKEGQELEAKIIAVDRKKRSLNLSIKEKELDEETAVMEKYSTDSDTDSGTLGDILKKHL